MMSPHHHFLPDSNVRHPSLKQQHPASFRDGGERLPSCCCTLMGNWHYEEYYGQVHLPD